MPRVTYRDADHSYHLSDGRAVIGVSRLLRLHGLVPDYNWSEEHSTRGTAVHVAIQNYLNRGWPAYPDEEINAHLDQFKAFLLAAHATVVASELVVYSAAHNFAGRLDLVLAIGGRKRPIVTDIKSGKRAAWHPCQVGLYTIAYAEETAQPVGSLDMGNLYLRPRGYSLSVDQQPRNTLAVCREIAWRPR